MMFGRFCSIFSIVLCLGFLASNSIQAQEHGMGPFRVSSLTIRNGYAEIKDPTGYAPTRRVQSFSISNTCSNVKHQPNSSRSDCTRGSVRAERIQKRSTQPSSAWYGWYFYLPVDFPVGREQKGRGTYVLGQFHNEYCPHIIFNHRSKSDKYLYFETERAIENGLECEVDVRHKIADMKSLRGKWHRLEMHIGWSTGSDGFADVYLDGRHVVAHRGRTITIGHEKINYLKYGVYLTNNKAPKQVVPATVLYTNVSSARRREGLR